MKATISVLAAIAALAGLTGCSDRGDHAGQHPATTSGAADPAQPGTTPPTGTTLPSRDDATVDARDYQQGDHFYFQSPTGNILCGIIDDANFGTGCQLVRAAVVPPELPDCGRAPDRAVAAEVGARGPRFLCLNQGVFVGAPVDGSNRGGGKVLGYGQTIIVRGTACTSMPTGVRCDQAGHGFLIAADAQSLF